jgi:signal transduction histidine kinase
MVAADAPAVTGRGTGTVAVDRWRGQSSLMKRIVVSGLVTIASVAAAICLVFLASDHFGTLTKIIILTAAAYIAIAFVGAAIVRAQPRNTVGWLFLISGAATPIGVVISCVAVTVAASGHLRAATWIDEFPTPFALAGVPLIATYGILLFPGRSLDTRGRRVLAWVYGCELLALGLWATFGTTMTDLPNVANPIGTPAADGGVLSILVLGPLSIFACVSLLRFARRDTGPHAPALRIAGRVSFIVPAAYLACVVVGISGGNTYDIASVENAAALALAIAAWIGIVRYGLFNTRAVLSRTLIYGSLSVAMAAIYLLTAVVLGHLFGGVVPQVAAAVAAALVILPLRDVAQRRINQLVYGLRDDPATAFARLGDRLDAAGVPEDILPAAARTVAEALRLPYVAIEVNGEVIGAYGRQMHGDTESLELPFAGETIGRLVLQTRADGDLAGADRQLLTDLTRQVAVAARAVASTLALQESRQRLVSLREDERRRLRRDLHDGLGPTLAGIALGIDTARRAIPSDAAASALLASLRQEVEAAVGDIRRIVYELRPPILDELGLAGAVREQAMRLCSATVDVPFELPALPAAVEVATYRIAVEALANAARHAPGSPVTVSLAVNGRVELSVADGGGGLPDGYRAGVGLTSMRERAAELGGLCVISRRDPIGTLVQAEIPLPTSEPA